MRARFLFVAGIIFLCALPAFSSKRIYVGNLPFSQVGVHFTEVRVLAGQEILAHFEKTDDGRMRAIVDWLGSLEAQD